MPRPGPTVPAARRRPGPSRRRAGGLATLAMVLGLLALAAWAAAASQRASVSELRSAADHLRAAEAFEAAQGGLDFTLALLHAGPLDAACLPTSGPSRSLAEWLDLGTLGLACQRLDEGWACRCPHPDAAAVARPPASAAPGFRVEARQAAAGGAVQIRATGWGAGGGGLATVTTLAIPQPGMPPTAWRRVPGSWRDF